jgi:hypothetical protein
MQILLVIVIVALGFGPAFAESPRHIDLEFRVGAGMVCGTCKERGDYDWKVRPTMQLLGDLLFPVAQIGPGTFELGPYAKGALLDGVNIPQVAGGLMLGYRWSRWELLLNGGLAYATERVGILQTHPGQTKHSYDVGITLRYDIAQYFLSGGYVHNSNGYGARINLFGGKGFNPGYDQLFLGLGRRF